MRLNLQMGTPYLPELDRRLLSYVFHPLHDTGRTIQTQRVHSPGTAYSSIRSVTHQSFQAHLRAKSETATRRRP